MKFFITPLCAAALALSITACSKDATAPSQTAEKAEENAVSAAEIAEPAVAEAESAAPEAATAPVVETVSEFAGLPAPYNAAKYSVGKRTFKLCATCHTVDEGAGNLVGPNLWGVVGANAGANADFAYSPAMLESGITWTPENLAGYLENPAKFIKGNRMSFAGVRRPADREALIAYLMLQTGYTGE